VRVPPAVAERLEDMTDDEIVAAYVANGETEAYARACLPMLRGEAPPSGEDLSKFLG
jgi:hypothetical protein